MISLSEVTTISKAFRAREFLNNAALSNKLVSRTNLTLIVEVVGNCELSCILSGRSGFKNFGRWGNMGNRFSGLRDDNFFALSNPIEELNNVCGDFGNVGNHSFPRNNGFCYSKMAFGIENGECGKVLFSFQFDRLG